jgi:hypothetical protein
VWLVFSAVGELRVEQTYAVLLFKAVVGAIREQQRAEFFGLQVHRYADHA